MAIAGVLIGVAWLLLIPATEWWYRRAQHRHGQRPPTIRWVGHTLAVGFAIASFLAAADVRGPWLGFTVALVVGTGFVSHVASQLFGLFRWLDRHSRSDDDEMPRPSTPRSR